MLRIRLAHITPRVAFFFALILVAISLPFSPRLNGLSIILLAICWIWEGDLMGKMRKAAGNPLVRLHVGFYLCFVMAMLYTEDVENGAFNLEKKLSLLVLPLTIGTSSSFDSNMRGKVLLLFVFSILLAVFISMSVATYNFVQTGDLNFFLHEKLASTLDIQPPYFGMFVAMTIVILISYGRRGSRDSWVWPTPVLIIAVLMLTFFVILLSARTSAIYIMVLGLALAFSLKSRIHRLWSLAVVILMLGLTIFLAFRSAYLYNRFVAPILSDISVTDGGGETGLSIRLVKWKCSIEGIVENPLFGVGTGDAVNYLVQCYKEKNFWGMYDQYRYNSHNQYLETALTLGLLGLVLLLGSFMVASFNAMRIQDFVCLGFLALVSFCCLTESLLERQWGVVFYSLFVSILSFAPVSNLVRSE